MSIPWIVPPTGELDLPTSGSATEDRVAIGDLTGDGLPDVFHVGSGFHLQQADGSFAPPFALDEGFDVLVADYTGDGIDDALSATTGVLRVGGSLFPNEVLSVACPLWSPVPIGRPDGLTLITTCYDTTHVVAWTSEADTGWSWSGSDAWFQPSIVPLGDLNGDGYDDLAVSDGRAPDEDLVALFLGGPDGLPAVGAEVAVPEGFTGGELAAITLPTGERRLAATFGEQFAIWGEDPTLPPLVVESAWDWPAAFVGDYGGDGGDDLLVWVAYESDGYASWEYPATCSEVVWLQHGTGSGFFPRPDMVFGARGVKLSSYGSDDVDGDGRSDVWVVVPDDPGSGWRLAWWAAGTTAGAPVVPVAEPCGPPPEAETPPETGETPEPVPDAPPATPAAQAEPATGCATGTGPAAVGWLAAILLVRRKRA